MKKKRIYYVTWCCLSDKTHAVGQAYFAQNHKPNHNDIDSWKEAIKKSECLSKTPMIMFFTEIEDV